MATESTEKHGKIKNKKPVMATEAHGNTRKKFNKIKSEK
jgi:hypothetical protein